MTLKTKEEIANQVEATLRSGMITTNEAILLAIEVDRKQRDAVMRHVFQNTVWANYLANEPETLDGLKKLSERVNQKADEFYEVRTALKALEAQRDAVRSFLGIGQ